MESKVFGIGLNKTGTTTLSKCLIELGYNHMSARRDLLKDWFNGDFEQLFQVCDEYDSFDDWPYSLAYKELFYRYGDTGRYILTIRSLPETWLRSLKNHSLQTNPVEHCRLLAYGYNYPHGFERQHINFYEKHTSDVIAFFQKNDAVHLLKVICWEKGDDWQSLCSFLNKHVPKMEFPHSNKMTKSRIVESEFFHQNISRILEQLQLLKTNLPGNLSDEYFIGYQL